MTHRRSVRKTPASVEAPWLNWVDVPAVLVNTTWPPTTVVQLPEPVQLMFCPGTARNTL